MRHRPLYCSQKDIIALVFGSTGNQGGLGGGLEHEMSSIDSCVLLFLVECRVPAED